LVNIIPEFLETQANIWDAQSDMQFATIRAILGLALLYKSQDKELIKIKYLIKKHHYNLLMMLFLLDLKVV
jgi:hypothetical protein